MKMNPDYEGFLKCLNDHKVRYLVVGAHAVSYYTRPRFTKDLDILIEPSLQNARRILQALKDFGFISLEISLKDLSDPKSIIQLGVVPNRVDLIGSIEGVSFKAAWKNRVSGIYGKEDVAYLSLKDLVRTKEISGREQDKLDLKYLKKIKK